MHTINTCADIGDIGGKRPASMDKRWSRLIELKKALI